MPQVSKYPLDRYLKNQIFRQFWVSISQLHTADDVSSFLSDLLSDTEEIMLAKRFTIAVLILRGKRPVEISGILHVSYSTIRSVASWLKNAKPRTRTMLLKITKTDSWQKVMDVLDAVLDELPPRYGTNWSRAGKEKWQRALERASRQSLR
ncbi:Trp family transcriptional regulator [Patescibacteria group bacterium]|nr:Trp family transcriptional regulator [Patescibacteria group bacterium]